MNHTDPIFPNAPAQERADAALLSSFWIAIVVSLILGGIWALIRYFWPHLCHLAWADASRSTIARLRLRATGVKSLSFVRLLFHFIIAPLETQATFGTHLGREAALYIRVLREGIVLCALLAVYGLGVLIPIHATSTRHLLPIDSSLHTTGTARLSMANIETSDDEESQRLWAHVVGVYLTTALVLWRVCALYSHYYLHAMAGLSYALPSTRTVRISRIPHNVDIAAILRTHFSHALLSVHPVRDPSSLKVALHHLKRSKTHVQETRARAALRIAVSVPSWTHCAFATFISNVTMRKAVGCFLSCDPSILRVKPAPPPDLVRWGSLLHRPWLRRLNRGIALVALIALIILWSVPVGAALAATQLEKLSRLPALGVVLAWLADRDEVIRSLLEGLLPALVVLIAYALALPVIRLLSRFALPRSEGSLERRAHWAWWGLLTVNVFFGSFLAGSVFAIIAQFQELFKKPFEFVSLLAVKLPLQVNFFISYVLAASLLAYAVVLLRPFDFLLLVFRRFQRPKRYAFNYVLSYGYHALIFLIVLVYSTMAPIVLPFGLLYFICSYGVDLYNFLHVHQGPEDRRAVLWPALFTQMCIALVLYQLTLIAVLGVSGFFGSSALYPLPFITMIVWAVTRNRYLSITRTGSLDLEERDAGYSQEEFENAYQEPTWAEALQTLQSGRVSHKVVALDEMDTTSLIAYEDLY